MTPHGGLSATASAHICAELQTLGISRRELARRMGVPHTYLIRRLNGYVELRPSDIEKAAAALGVPVARFLTDDQPGRAQQSPAGDAGVGVSPAAAPSVPPEADGAAPIPEAVRR